MKHRLINGDCLKVLARKQRYDCIFADPFDNIGLGYNEFDDKMPDHEYVNWLGRFIEAAIYRTNVLWLSFNAKWTFAVGRVFENLIYRYAASPRKLVGKPCVQVFTFGQHNNHDLGNNHRPLWRLMWDDAKLYPDQIRVPSWRQLNGDKRASPKGRVPGDVLDMQYPHAAAVDIGMWLSGALDDPNACPEFKDAINTFFETHCGDVFDFPRVTGNSAQRRSFHPTQLHEELVKRAIMLTTKEGDHVCDPFGGTGTTLRVCKGIERQCTLIEMDPFYCGKISEEHGIPITKRNPNPKRKAS
jgi:hypothetical protein